MEHYKRALENLVEKIRTNLESEPAVLFGYLFGSVAAGNAISTSDIDVAVYLINENKTNLLDRRLALIEKLTRALQKEVDVLVLNTASPFLKYAVLKEGALVFEREPQERIEFELKAINEYFDYKPVLDKYHERLATV